MATLVSAPRLTVTGPKVRKLSGPLVNTHSQEHIRTGGLGKSV